MRDLRTSRVEQHLCVDATITPRGCGEAGATRSVHRLRRDHAARRRGVRLGKRAASQRCERARPVRDGVRLRWRDRDRLRESRGHPTGLPRRIERRGGEAMPGRVPQRCDVAGAIASAHEVPSAGHAAGLNDLEASANLGVRERVRDLAGHRGEVVMLTLGGDRHGVRRRREASCGLRRQRCDRHRYCRDNRQSAGREQLGRQWHVGLRMDEAGLSIRKSAVPPTVLTRSTRTA
jgi:hypothetical protein